MNNSGECGLAFRCAKISSMRILSSSKAWLACIITLIFCFYIYIPAGQIAGFFGLSVSPWLSPFYMSFYLMLLVHGGVVLLIFSDTGECDGYSNLVIARTGRRAYIEGELISICGVAFLYALIPLISSFIFVLPNLRWDSDWGTLLYTMAESPGEIMERSGISSSLIVEGEVLRLFTPISATLISFLCLWTSAAFLGMLVCFFTVLISKRAGIAAAGFLVCLSLFSRLLGSITVGKWLQYFSPMTWSSFVYIDWFYSGLTPSPIYAFSVWIGAMLIMGYITVKKFTAQHDN